MYLILFCLIYKDGINCKKKKQKSLKFQEQISDSKREIMQKRESGDLFDKF